MEKALNDLERAFSVLVDDLKGLDADQRKSGQQNSSKRQTEVHELSDLIIRLKKRINIVRDKKEQLEDGFEAISNGGGLESIFSHHTNLQAFGADLDKADNAGNEDIKSEDDHRIKDLTDDIARCQPLLLGRGCEGTVLLMRKSDVDVSKFGVGVSKDMASQNEENTAANMPSPSKMAFLKKVTGVEV